MKEQVHGPVISVVVCTFNRADLLPYCLESLAKQTLDKHLYEVIVVDNNSTDDTQQVLVSFVEKYTNFRCCQEPQQGHSHARNRGWREATGEFIAYIDDDTQATPAWCEKILHAFRFVEPTPVAVGGEIHPWYEETPPSWFSDDFEIRTWGKDRGFLQPPGGKFGFSGANMAFARRVIELVGGFSSHYGIVNGKLRMGEDTELFTRIYEQEPLFWYDPEIKVYHWTTKKMMTLSYRFKRSFKNGSSMSYLQGRQIWSVTYWRSWASLLLFFCRVPKFLHTIPGKFRTKLVIKLEEFAYRLGLLIG